MHTLNCRFTCPQALGLVAVASRSFSLNPIRRPSAHTQVQRPQHKHPFAMWTWDSTGSTACNGDWIQLGTWRAHWIETSPGQRLEISRWTNSGSKQYCIFTACAKGLVMHLSSLNKSTSVQKSLSESTTCQISSISTHHLHSGKRTGTQPFLPAALPLPWTASASQSDDLHKATRTLLVSLWTYEILIRADFNGGQEKKCALCMEPHDLCMEEKVHTWDEPER